MQGASFAWAWPKSPRLKRPPRRGVSLHFHKGIEDMTGELSFDALKNTTAAGEIDTVLACVIDMQGPLACPALRRR